MGYRVITTAATGTPEWHAARHGKIGGSAAVNIILGGDPDPDIRTFGTPLTEWIRLTGRQVDQTEDNAVLRFGRESEPMHRRWLEDDTKGRTEDAPGVLQHDTIPWLAVTPDGFIWMPVAQAGATIAERKLVLELKAPIPQTLKKWKDGAPVMHKVQAALYMYVLDVDGALVSALSQTKGPLYSIVERDRKFEQFMIEVLGHFMDYHVAKDIPPKVTGKNDERSAVMRSHPRENGLSIDLDRDKFEPIFDDLATVQARIKADELTEERLKTELALAIAPNSEGICGPWRATYRWQSRAAHMVRASEFPVLRTSRS